MSEQRYLNAAFYRYFPFAVFMVFIGLDEFIRFIASHGYITLGQTTLFNLYPVKTIVVSYLLYRYRKEYSELNFKDLANLQATIASFSLGLLVFVLWIQMDWTFGANVPQGFNPTLLPGKGYQISMLLFRAAGAVLVVPLMEELFWRSFLIRYIIDKDFENIQIGKFSWVSFLLTVLFFGLEHNFILAGMMAGILYNLVLYRTRSIAQCVFVHAVTNLALAIYVVYTGEWQFW